MGWWRPWSNSSTVATTAPVSDGAPLPQARHGPAEELLSWTAPAARYPHEEPWRRLL